MIAHNKKNGVYYTPPNLANAIVAHIEPILRKATNMLEPSVGGGIFVESAHNAAEHLEITAIDIDEKTICVFNQLPIKTRICADFLTVELPHTSFDVIIGNPPYISWKNMSEGQRDIARKTLKKVNLGLPSLNMWGLFLIHAMELLSREGVMAFVLPSDIKETISGGKVLDYLIKKFDRIELFDVPKNSFKGAEQNTTIFVGHKKHSEKGLFKGNVCLDTFEMQTCKHTVDSFGIFSKASIPFDESVFLKLVKSYERMPKMGDLCSTSPGIVTAANGFFIVPQQKAISLGIESNNNRIIPKGQFINGKLDISEDFFNELCEQNIPCYLFAPHALDDLSRQAQAYLNEGEHIGLPQRYKMRNRTPWYRIPSIWTSECLFFKRTHVYPKMILNDANLLTTDAAYRLRLNDQTDKQSLIFSFYNSYTLLFAEILGRKYAGGVLELTPSEFKKLPVPIKECSPLQFSTFKQRFNNKTNIHEILDTYDNEILSDYMSLSDIAQIGELYREMLNKRLN